MLTQKYVNDIAYNVVGCAIELHKELGPGLLESIYQKCMIEELKGRKLNVKSQVNIPLKYKGKSLDCNLVLDLLINDLIVVELKSVEMLLPIHKVQLLTYLKLTALPKGLLINFNTANIANSLVPLVTEEFSHLPTG